MASSVKALKQVGEASVRRGPSALAADSLRNQERGDAVLAQHCGMELAELEVGQVNASPQCHGHAIGVGVLRIAGDVPQPASATVGQHGGAGQHALNGAICV